MKRTLALFFFGLLILAPLTSRAEILTVGYPSDSRWSKGAENYLFGMTHPESGIFETLVKLEDDFTISPLLAESWERGADGIFTVKLRKGVKFHDGSDFDAEALKACFEFHAKRKNYPVPIDMSTFQVADSHTVKFQPLDRNFVHIMGSLANGVYGVLQVKNNPHLDPIGTGPYQFKEYRKGEFAELVRFDGYWGEPAPNERVVIRFIADDQTRLMALLAGKMDIIPKLSPVFIAQLPENPKYELIQGQKSITFGCFVNAHGSETHNIMRELAVRQALALSMDRQTMADAIYGKGRAAPAKTFMSRLFWNLGDDWVQAYPYNPREAESILEKAGWEKGPDGVRVKDGRRLVVELAAGWPTASEYRPLPEMIQQMAKVTGFEVKLSLTDDPGVLFGTYWGPGKCDLLMDQPYPGDGDPSYFLYNVFHSQGMFSGWGYGVAGPGPEYDKVIETARQSSDHKVVVESIIKAQQIIIDEYVSFIPLVEGPQCVIVAKGVKLTIGPVPPYTNYSLATKR